MTQEEIIQAISDDKMMPFIQPDQLAEIVDFVIKNYKPSLPSNMDEAANNWITTLWDTPGTNWTNGDILRSFKAGAKWMARQGVKIGETEIYLEYDGGEPPYDGTSWLELTGTEYPIPKDKFKDGDKVDIILRKKQ